MALVCYLDDSGNKDDPIATLAGYIAPARNWLDFEVGARALFDAHELPYLHTVDLHRREGEFEGWTREQTAGFEYSVLKSTFEFGKRVYNVEHQSLPIRLTPMTATCRVPPLSRVKLGIGWSRGVARDAEQ